MVFFISEGHPVQCRGWMGKSNLSGSLHSPGVPQMRADLNLNVGSGGDGGEDEVDSRTI